MANRLSVSGDQQRHRRLARCRYRSDRGDRVVGGLDCRLRLRCDIFSGDGESGRWSRSVARGFLRAPSWRAAFLAGAFLRGRLFRGRFLGGGFRRAFWLPWRAGFLAGGVDAPSSASLWGGSCGSAMRPLLCRFLSSPSVPIMPGRVAAPPGGNSHGLRRTAHRQPAPMSATATTTNGHAGMPLVG